MRIILDSADIQKALKNYIENLGLDLSDKSISLAGQDSIEIEISQDDEAKSTSAPEPLEPTVKRRTRRTKEQINADNKAKEESTEEPETESLEIQNIEESEDSVEEVTESVLEPDDKPLASKTDGTGLFE